MVDGQWRSVDLALGHGEQRNVPPAGRSKIDGVQPFRGLPILGSDFQHHVILIQLRVNDGDFRLTECIIECRIQGLDRKAELCRGDAGHRSKLIQAAILLI